MKKSSKRRKTRPGAKRSAKQPAKSPAAKTTDVKPDSKQARVVQMLQSPSGATIDSMMKVTDWQQHSVRGFLAGVVRKRLKLKLTSQKVDGERIYRVADRKAARAHSDPPPVAAG